MLIVTDSNNTRHARRQGVGIPSWHETQGTRGKYGYEVGWFEDKYVYE